MRDTRLSEAVDMMIQTDRMHKALIECRIKDIGIHRTQHKILMRLSFCGRLPSQKELAEHLGITPAAVTGALKKLEADGYVERSLGDDNRFNELLITEKGRALVELTKKKFSEVDTSVFEGFSAEELACYIEFLNKIQENMKRFSQRKTIKEANIKNEKMV